MRYYEFKKKQQDEFDKLPMKAAFGDKQFEEMMSEWGLTTSKKDLAKIAQLGPGGYCLKEDYPKFIALANRHMEEMEEFLSNDDNLIDALKYEFANHECGYTWEFENGITALGYTIEEFFSEERKKRLFIKARQEYIKNLED